MGKIGHIHLSESFVETLNVPWPANLGFCLYQSNSEHRKQNIKSSKKQKKEVEVDPTKLHLTNIQSSQVKYM